MTALSVDYILGAAAYILGGIAAGTLARFTWTQRRGRR